MKVLIGDVSTLQPSLGENGVDPHPLSEFAAKLVQLSPLTAQRWVGLAPFLFGAHSLCECFFFFFFFFFFFCSGEVQSALESFCNDNTIVVLNKVDLLPQPYISQVKVMMALVTHAECKLPVPPIQKGRHYFSVLGVMHDWGRNRTAY